MSAFEQLPAKPKQSAPRRWGDRYLTSELAVPLIQTVSSNGKSASVRRSASA
jgi:hypothetical protein